MRDVWEEGEIAGLNTFSSAAGSKWPRQCDTIFPWKHFLEMEPVVFRGGSGFSHFWR
jgi:hypothetical protein